jgi:nucleoside-diphosphate-sugar epimerase
VRAIVIGATGQVGFAITQALLAHSYTVTACHRGSRALQPELRKAGCKEAVGDRYTSESVAGALKAGADLLVDVVPMVDADAEQLLSVAGNFGSIIAVSTGAVYADDQGRSLQSAAQTGYPQFPPLIHETQRTVEPDAETYGGRKVALERRLLDGASCDVAVLRPCAIHGRYARDLREIWFLKRLLDGRPFAPLAYDGQSCFHTCAAEAVAIAVVASARAGGTRIVNVADSDAPTVRQIGQTLLGGTSEMEIVCLDGPPVNGVGRSPWSVPQPIRLDTSAALALCGDLGLYSDAVSGTAEWALAELRQRHWATTFPKLASYPFSLFDYAAEDARLR